MNLLKEILPFLNTITLLDTKNPYVIVSMIFSEPHKILLRAECKRIFK